MERRREDMSHPVTLIDYVDHLYAIEDPTVERLSSRTGIECCPVQIDPLRVFGAADYRCLEVAKVGVGIIESVRHREPGAGE